uniref:Uncharacterized protein n=1 Tax=Rhizophora mucronata TaxID=61149 RepID=A0A2P2Q812_RHIMU
MWKRNTPQKLYPLGWESPNSYKLYIRISYFRCEI